MSNVLVSMKMTAKQAGSLYMKAIKLEDENKELKSLNKEMRAMLEVCNDFISSDVNCGPQGLGLTVMIQELLEKASNHE